MSANGILSVFINFLDSKTDSILAVAAAMAIGGSFKDLITTIVNNFLQPLVVKLILFTNIGRISKLVNANNIFTPENGILNFSNVVVSIISFILIVATVYFMVAIINNIGNTISNNNPQTNNNPQIKNNKKQ